MNNKTFLILFSFLFVSFLSTFFVYTQHHETIHFDINKNFGCINQTKEVSIFKGSVTCHEFKNTTEEQNNIRNTLHSQNELVGYYIILLISVIYIILFFVLFCLFLKEDR